MQLLISMVTLESLRCIEHKFYTSGSYSRHGKTSFEGHEAKYWENDETSENARAAVQNWHQYRIPKSEGRLVSKISKHARSYQHAIISWLFHRKCHNAVVSPIQLKHQEIIMHQTAMITISTWADFIYNMFQILTIDYCCGTDCN